MSPQHHQVLGLINIKGNLWVAFYVDCMMTGFSVAQTEIIGTSKHLGLSGTDRIEAHDRKDE